jgi:hypothetical protein
MAITIMTTGRPAAIGVLQRRSRELLRHLVAGVGGSSGRVIPAVPRSGRENRAVTTS